MKIEKFNVTRSRKKTVVSISITWLALTKMC